MEIDAIYAPNVSFHFTTEANRRKRQSVYNQDHRRNRKMRIVMGTAFRRNTLLIAVIFALMAGVLVIASEQRPTEAQSPDPAALSALVMQLRSQGVSLTFQFVKPLDSGETSITLPDTDSGRDIARAGSDYVCFAEPWNNSRKLICTPTSNVLSVSYTE
jgi:hypothetical protein